MSLRRPFLSLLLASLLFLTVDPSVVADDDPDGTDRPSSTRARPKGPPERNGTAAPRNETGSPGNESARQGPPARGPDANESSNESSYGGRYVAFSFDEGSCSITGYRLYNVSILDSIQLPSPCDARSRRGSDDGEGKAFQIGGRDAYVRIHDSPNGLLHLHGSDEHSILVQPASDATTREVDDGTEITVGNLTGLLRVEESETDPWTVVDHARLWFHPLAGSTPERTEIREAIRERKVAGEVDVRLEDGNISSDVLAYEDVVIKAAKTSTGSFRFLIDGNLTEGRTFVVNLGPGVFDQEMVGLRYWDLDETGLATEVSISRADNLSDVLEILDGEGPEYWVVHDDAGKHVMVAVPSFSVHVFEILSMPPQVVPIVTWGLVGGLAFVALGAIGLRRRR